MTKNVERCAFVINETYADEYVKPHMTPLAVAQALADAGLLMPELPEPDCRHDDPEYREEYSDAWGTSNAPDAWEALEGIANRAKKAEAEMKRLEGERDEACNKIARLTFQASTAENDRKLAWRAMDKIRSEKGEAIRECNDARVEVEQLKATVAEREKVAADQGMNYVETPNSSHPDPADVKPGEAWIVKVDGEHRNAVKDRAGVCPWNTVGQDGVYHGAYDDDIVLMTRLMPAQRVITDAKELDTLANGSVVLSDKNAFTRRSTAFGILWFSPSIVYGVNPLELTKSGPVTVLWEPEDEK